MAARSAAPANDARAEREFNTDVNNAIAATNQEIFDAAMDDEPLDNDGDRSLEEMGDGLEGEVLDDEDDADDAEPEARAGADADAEGDEADPDADEGEEGDEPELEAPAPRRGEERPERGQVPPARLREANDARRAAEKERDDLRYEMQTLNARFNDMQARLNQPQQPQAQAPAQVQAPQKPDMFADPEGYENWVIAEAERRAEAKIDARFSRQTEQQQQREMERVNGALHAAATGERGFEFHPAFQKLTSQDARDPKVRQLVQSIYTAPDPGKALFDWWDNEGGGQDFRDQVAERLGFLEPQAPRGRQQQREPMREARHETRLPGQASRSRLPSLNSAHGGGGRQQVVDPEMYDGSESSIADYAFRR